jgi:hypothetical protein
MGMHRFASEQVPNVFKKLTFFTHRADDLTYLADRFGSDKGNLVAGHGYARIYQRFFHPLRDKAIVLLELGLLSAEADHRRGMSAAEGETNAVAMRAPSLQMWRSFFPRAKIFGFDIDDFTRVRISGCSIIRGDMSSPRDLERCVEAIGERIDIIIDDASHVSNHQQIALGYLFPHLRTGGIYAIEDLGWQPESLEKPGIPKSRDMLRRLQVNGVLETPAIPAEQRKAIEENLQKIWLFDSLTADFDDPTDSLALLIRK